MTYEVSEIDPDTTGGPNTVDRTYSVIIVRFQVVLRYLIFQMLGKWLPNPAELPNCSLNSMLKSHFQGSSF